MNWLIRVIFSIIGFFVFQNSIIAVSVSNVNSGFDPHNTIFETYTYDENEIPVWVEGSYSSRVNCALSKGDVGLEHYVGKFENGVLKAVDDFKFK